VAGDPIAKVRPQHHLEDLDRHAALALLSRIFLDALKLPTDLRAFGEASRFELEPLVLALNREWQRQSATEIRVYLGGDAGDWEPLGWRFRSEVARLAETGVSLQMIALTETLEQLQQSQRDELAALIGVTSAQLYVAPSGLTVGSPAMHLILELGSEHSLCSLGRQRIRWAGTLSTLG
jgi:DEAD/DEAH box helicase domain-containing protein